MKKFLKIVFIEFILVFLIVGQVKADIEPCTVTLSSSKKTLKPGDKVTLNVMISNINLDEGIKTLVAMVDYDDKIFEVEYDESQESMDEMAEFAAATGYDETKVATLYLGKNDEEIANNSWNAMAITDNNGKMAGIVAYSSEAEKDTQAVAKINLKVKDDAPNTSTKIAFEGMSASTDGKNDKEISQNQSITYKIQAEEANNQAEETANAQTSTQKEETKKTGSTTNNNSNSNNNNSDGNVTQNQTPYTGLEDYILPISIVLIIGIISFIEYRKYKDINI